MPKHFQISSIIDFGAGFGAASSAVEKININYEGLEVDPWCLTLAKDLNNHDFGIIICGSANGVSMTANKYNGVRAAICWEEEIAKLARQHNNANILSLPARFIEEDKAIKITEAFLETEFEGGRHERRVNKIDR